MHASKSKIPKPTYVSLFSSGGIGDYGLKKAGFECVATAELLSRRLEVQRLNKLALDEGYICGDLSVDGIYQSVITKANDFISSTGHPLTLLVATPPCQGMSVANHKKKDELSRNSLVVQSIKAVSEIKPLVFLFENVPAFINTICTGSDGIDRRIGEEIERQLGATYEFYSRTMQLSQFGAHSSRKRSLTIGVRNDVLWTTPLDLFPNREEAPSLRDLIGHLPALKEMGKSAETDLFHNYKAFDERMLPWIENLKPGESAFDNSEEHLRPHRIIDGKLVPNVNKNGDKYRRVRWESVAPCVHTRNDILASQNTVHPVDNRVFSIRELMLMMGLDSDFKWFDGQETAQATHDIKLLKKHESNIRQCLGEAVPAQITEKIGKNIATFLLGHCEYRGGKPRFSLNENSSQTLTQLASYVELSGAKKRQLSAFYTQPLPAFAVLKRALSKYSKTKKIIRVLEPSVGGGVFIALLSQFAQEHRLAITALDIDPDAIEHLQKIYQGQTDFEVVEFIHKDFIQADLEDRYDLIVGNPPFGRTAAVKGLQWGTHPELAVRFFQRSVTLSGNVAFVFPKALLHAQTYSQLRTILLQQGSITSVIDFGELAFPDVKVETIGLLWHPAQSIQDQFCEVKSFPKETRDQQATEYIFSNEHPSWIIYRNEFFDEVIEKVSLGRFKSFRDRKISRKLSVNEGPVRVLRGRNIGYAGEFTETPNDYFVSKEIAEKTQSELAKLINGAAFLAPNLSYSPRTMAYNPSPLVVPEGSCAVLIGELTKSEADAFVEFSRSEEFELFYRIACNFATRSINIDSILSYWWAVPKMTIE